jgi:hypothetical protein
MRRTLGALCVAASTTDMSMRPSYPRIIGLGPSALPLILESLEEQPQHWFWALQAVTGENPVTPEHVGLMAEMTGDWLKWARSSGVID